ncbi:MAG: GxxExxY protein [Chitinophagaceae bacterium]|nr:MAG: GxxExxY protein [Chitinophagaceae bacterium]
MSENEVAAIIVDLCYHIHRRYGPGLLDSVYETILYHELKKAGLSVERQKWVHIWHDDLFVRNAFRADLIVEKIVLIELKSVVDLPRCYHKIVITYLTLTHIKPALLINFRVGLFKEGVHRIVNNL